MNPTSSTRPSRRDRSTNASDQGAHLPYTKWTCSALHQLTPAELPGSRQDGRNIGEQRNHPGLQRYIEDPTEVPCEHQPRKQRTTLNRLRTGMGHFREAMQWWGLVDSAHCECGDHLPTVDHVLTSCPKHRPPNADLGLMNLDDDTLEWPAVTELKI